MMSQAPNPNLFPGNQGQQGAPPSGPANPPHDIASAIGSRVRALVVSVFWIVTGVAAVAVGLAVGYLTLRLTWWFVQIVTQAAGI